MASASGPFKIVLKWDADEQVWVSHVTELGDISTYGDTLEEAVAQTRESILGYLETAAAWPCGARLSSGQSRPERRYRFLWSRLSKTARY